MIDVGSDVNVFDVSDDILLYVFVGFGYMEVVCLLLDNGVDLNVVDKEGWIFVECVKLFGYDNL